MKASRFWEYINMSQLSMNSIKEQLPNFKSSKVNFNISLHDPADDGARYLRTLIYLMAEGMTDEMFEKLKKVKGRLKGYPIAISYRGESVCLDYAQAIYELDFIERYCDLNGMDILEIGAGYGRVCHTIMSNYDVNYTIADLDNCLALAYRYLSEVLSAEQFKRIRFVSIEHESLCSDFDLCICMDVFPELDKEQAEHYVKYVNEHCRYFYLKSQVCQYDANVYDARNTRMIKLCLNRLFDRINITDDREVKSQIPKFIESYRPEGWACLGNSNAKPYMHYWQAMYRKEK